MAQDGGYGTAPAVAKSASMAPTHTLYMTLRLSRCWRRSSSQTGVIAPVYSSDASREVVGGALSSGFDAWGALLSSIHRKAALLAVGFVRQQPMTYEQ